MKQGIEILLLLATGIFKQKARNESLVWWQLHVAFCFLSRPPGNAVPARETLMYTSCRNTWWESSTSIFWKLIIHLFYNIFTNSNRLVILLRPIFHLYFHHIHCYCCCCCCLFQYITIIFSFPFLYLLVQNTVSLVCLHVHQHWTTCLFHLLWISSSINVNNLYQIFYICQPAALRSPRLILCAWGVVHKVEVSTPYDSQQPWFMNGGRFCTLVCKLLLLHKVVLLTLCHKMECFSCLNSSHLFFFF